MQFRFPDDTPAALVRLQKQHWDPLFAWVRDEFGVELAVAEGLTPARQSDETMERLRSAVESMDIWELAGLKIFSGKECMLTGE